MTDEDIYRKCLKMLLVMNELLESTKKIVEPAVQEQARRNIETILELVDRMNCILEQ